MEWLRKELLTEVEKQKKMQETIYEWDEEDEDNRHNNNNNMLRSSTGSHRNSENRTHEDKLLRESQSLIQIELAVKLACFDNNEDNGLSPEHFLSILTFVIIQAELEKPLTMRSLLWSLCEPSLLKGERGYVVRDITTKLFF